MKTFPMFLSMAGRRVVIAGGAEQAAQKARLIARTEAMIVLLAETLDEELAGMVAEGRATHLAEPAAPAHFEGAALVFIATGEAAQDEALHAMAKAAGALVNVVDRPELCDALTPSIVDRDPVVVAIGTEGTAPVLGRQIKTRIETMLEPRLGALAALAGRLRGAVARGVPMAQRREFWRGVFSGEPRDLHASGAERAAAQAIKQAIEAGEAPGAQACGMISLVGAGPGTRDLLTLRAVKRLQEADVIFYDRLVDSEVLEMARRDAERVYVGKAVGASDWPQERIDAVIIAAARQGKRVVRLKSGDPGMFGRATEEIAAARANGIPIEMVPGVTAASAAGAALGRSLTERGATDRVVFATGTCRDGDAAPDWGAFSQPGTTLALYMGVRQAARIERNLRDSGACGSLEVEVVSNISTPEQKIVTCRLSELSRTVQSERIPNPAIILIRNPKNRGAEEAIDPRFDQDAMRLTALAAPARGRRENHLPAAQPSMGGR